MKAICCKEPQKTNVSFCPKTFPNFTMAEDPKANALEEKRWFKKMEPKTPRAYPMVGMNGNDSILGILREKSRNPSVLVRFINSSDFVQLPQLGFSVWIS